MANETIKFKEIGRQTKKRNHYLCTFQQDYIILLYLPYLILNYMKHTFDTVIITRVFKNKN